MNVVKQFFYNRAKRTAELSIEQIGLQINDNTKFEIYLNKRAKRSMIYAGLFAAVIIYLIIGWFI